MNVLLIGGTGYVGSALSRLLKQNNFSVTSIGRFTSTKYIIGTEVDEKMFFNTDIVVYLSWYFDANDNKYEDKNIKSFSNIVEICKSRKIKLIFISTLFASKYSKSKYNKTKAECEKIALKNNFSVVRFGSVILKGYELEGTYKKLETFVRKYRIYPKIYPVASSFQKTGIAELKNFSNSLKSLKNQVYVYTNFKNETLEDILNLKKNFYFSIPIHWSMIFFPLKLLETLNIPSPVNSDIVKSIWLPNKK